MSRSSTALVAAGMLLVVACQAPRDTSAGGRAGGTEAHAPLALIEGKDDVLG